MARCTYQDVHGIFKVRYSGMSLATYMFDERFTAKLRMGANQTSSACGVFSGRPINIRGHAVFKPAEGHSHYLVKQGG